MRLAVSFTCVLVVAASLVSGSLGCAQQPAVRSNVDKGGTIAAEATPMVARLPSGITMELPKNVGFLRGVTNRGNLLVSLWKDANPPVIGEEIYEYDIASGQFRYLVGPSDPQLTIISASLFNSWLLWGESRRVVEGLGWKLHLKNLETGEDAILAQDDLGIPEGTILANIAPHNPSINARYAAWDQLTRNGDSFDSQIFLYDLRSKERRSIARIQRGGLDLVVSSPQLYDNLVVWNKVFYDRANLVAHPDVYLLDIDKGEVRQLTNNGKSFAPVVSGNHVAWMYRSTPEGVYGQIELYDLATNQLRRLTDSDPREGNWGPSIGSQAVAWQTTLADKAQAYDLASKRLLVLDSGYIDRVFTNANVVAWQWNEPNKDRIDPLARRIRFTLLPGDG